MWRCPRRPTNDRARHLAVIFFVLALERPNGIYRKPRATWKAHACCSNQIRLVQITGPPKRRVRRQACGNDLEPTFVDLVDGDVEVRQACVCPESWHTVARARSSGPARLRREMVAERAHKPSGRRRNVLVGVLVVAATIIPVVRAATAAPVAAGTETAAVVTIVAAVVMPVLVASASLVAAVVT